MLFDPTMRAPKPAFNWLTDSSEPKNNNIWILLVIWRQRPSSATCLYPTLLEGTARYQTASNRDSPSRDHRPVLPHICCLFHIWAIGWKFCREQHLWRLDGSQQTACGCMLGGYTVGKLEESPHTNRVDSPECTLPCCWWEVDTWDTSCWLCRSGVRKSALVRHRVETDLGVSSTKVYWNIWTD